MSEKEKPKDVFSLLFAFYHRTNNELRGEHGVRAWTRSVRVVALLLVLGLCGPLLWHALGTMPSGLIALIALAVIVRLGRRLWRR
jgi:hypothetical protein